MSQDQNSIVIVGAARTPMGGFQGSLSSVKGTDLGGVAIKAAVERAGLQPGDVEQVMMGLVIAAGAGQAPARQASLAAGLPLETSCTTVNKACGSAMEAMILAHDQLKAGSVDVMVAGGMESMSQLPYLLPKARTGLRMGDGQIFDSMFHDALADPFNALPEVKKSCLMGDFAQKGANDHNLSREAMDAFAIRSLTRAKQAIESGLAAQEIAPVTIKTRKGEQVVDTDEQPLTANIDKIPSLRPAFSKDGTITAANSSSISDGAAAVVMMTEAKAIARGLKPLARIVGHSTHALSPEEFPVAPAGAIEKLLKKISWSLDDVELHEINEAFAAVPMIAIKELGIDPERVNINGGACAVGHPVGCSGARIVVTLLNALKNAGKTRGMASICLGGGEATAIAIELI